MNYEIKDWPDRKGYWWCKDRQEACLVWSELVDGEFMVIELVDDADWLRKSHYKGFPEIRFAWLGEKFPEDES